MQYEIERYLGKNITLVYRVLPLEPIERDVLRHILGANTILGMDTPEMLVMISPNDRIVFQLGDRRIRITDQNNRPADENIICSMAFEANELADSELIAYGFNYDILVRHEEEGTPELLNRIFLPHKQEIEGIVQGKIQNIVPRIIYRREQTTYDWVVEVADDTHFKAHLNTHFERSSLPDIEELQRDFVTEFNGFCAILDRLPEE